LTSTPRPIALSKSSLHGVEVRSSIKQLGIHHAQVQRMVNLTLEF